MLNKQRRTLSSALTLYFKFILPTLMLVLWLGWGIWIALDPDLHFPGIPLLFFGTIIVSVFFRFNFRIKKVEMDDHRLYVSNYFREISLPLSEVESVSESWLTNPKLIYIRLKCDSPFGRKIVFTPSVRVLSQFKHHPVVDDLQRMLRQHSY